MQQELVLVRKEDLPKGSLRLKDFAEMCRVDVDIARNHSRVGLSCRRVYGTFNRREYLEATAILEGLKVHFYLTPEQQQKALVFWDRHRIKHGSPLYR